MAEVSYIVALKERTEVVPDLETAIFVKLFAQDRHY